MDRDQFKKPSEPRAPQRLRLYFERSLDAIPPAEQCKLCDTPMVKRYLQYELERGGVDICINHVPGYWCTSCEVEVWDRSTNALMFARLARSLQKMGRPDVASIWDPSIKPSIKEAHV